ncbi:condensation domain-containing protein, partial [Planomonospora algeriensis]
AFAHQDLPFERLVEVVDPVRSMARHPLFQVMLVLQNTPAVALDLDGLSVALEPFVPATAKFDLQLTLAEDPSGGLTGGLEYAADLFDRETAEDIAARFVRLLRAASPPPTPASGSSTSWTRPNGRPSSATGPAPAARPRSPPSCRSSRRGWRPHRRRWRWCAG